MITTLEDISLEIIKTYNIFLKEGEYSNELVLADNEGEGDMYFTFAVQYTYNEGDKKTYFNIKDKFHMEITIETLPDTITGPVRPFKLGTYGKDGELWMSFIMQSHSMDKTHNIIITFYTNKNK